LPLDSAGSGKGMAATASLDEINRRAWRVGDTLRHYRTLEGWTDPGERAAVAWVAEEAQGQPILDIGVGAGRTLPLLTAISRDYVAVDYTPAMVDACRAKHPAARVMHMDARDLSAFADNSFFLVVFSFNGLDAVDHTDRIRVLAEVHRVLRPGGLFLHSTHNRAGPSYDRQVRPRLEFTLDPLRLGWRLLRFARAAWLTARNSRRHRRLDHDFDGYAVRTAAAHDYAIVIIYVEQDAHRRQLARSGFATEIVFESADGQPVAEAADTSRSAWFHFIARKAAAEGAA
jgi:SAM-dependent methyltransferase